MYMIVADRESIEKCKAMIKKLSFPYEPPQFENPCIQKFYSNLEALALGRDEPEEITDFTSKRQSHYSLTAQHI